ncbi:MAG TPA: hypothetical protein VKA44_05185 [Gemmatimonadota bacterium]|nr:hypothetical protein [Gemmatimonadota bacterium]
MTRPDSLARRATRPSFAAAGLALAAAVALAAGPLGAQAPAAGSEDPSLDAVRQAAMKYRDVSVALAAGYIEDPSGMCVTAEMEGRAAGQGAMGLHYFRPDLLGLLPPQEGRRVDGTGTYTNFLDPAILLYEPQEDGSLVLIGVENLVFQKSWREAGHAAPPAYLGRSWDAMADDPATPVDEAHGFEPHFDQHVWVFRENPRGALEPFNPDVTCAHAAKHAMAGS